MAPPTLRSLRAGSLTCWRSTQQRWPAGPMRHGPGDLGFVDALVGASTVLVVGRRQALGGRVVVVPGAVDRTHRRDAVFQAQAAQRIVAALAQHHATPAEAGVVAHLPIAAVDRRGCAVIESAVVEVVDLLGRRERTPTSHFGFVERDLGRGLRGQRGGADGQCEFPMCGSCALLKPARSASSSISWVRRRARTRLAAAADYFLSFGSTLLPIPRRPPPRHRPLPAALPPVRMAPATPPTAAPVVVFLSRADMLPQAPRDRARRADASEIADGCSCVAP